MRAAPRLTFPLGFLLGAYPVPWRGTNASHSKPNPSYVIRCTATKEVTCTFTGMAIAMQSYFRFIEYTFSSSVKQHTVSKFTPPSVYHGAGPSVDEKVLVGPSGPSVASRHALAAPSSGESVPAWLLRLVEQNPGHEMLTFQSSRPSNCAA